MAHADVVAILTRAPSSGGKTRLFAELGLPPDPALLTALLLDTVDGVGGGARGPDGTWGSVGSWGPALAGPRPVIAVTPASRCAEVAALAPHAGVVAQPDGDLGDRMRGVMEAAFATGARRVALIGSDLPEIAAAHISSAFAMLDEDPAALVLGPARDGGYYLIAASRVPPVFSGIAWGGSGVLEQTRVRADESGWSVRLLSTLDDVDTLADLRRVCRTCPGSRTAAWARGRLTA